MRRWWFVLVMACALNKHAPPPDTQTLVDAAERDCGGDPCDVLAQTGCPIGMKCTWVIDEVQPDQLGHISCVTAGSVPVGGACTTTMGLECAEGSLADDCVGGALCADDGHCEQICDNNGGTPTCAAGTACKPHSGTFGAAGQPVAAGLCDPSCDPLTQVRDTDGSPACASADPSAPSTGCYTDDFVAFTCAPALTAQQDRDACTAANGCAVDSSHLFTNGCAPGFVPFFFDSTGSTQVDCAALCAPLDTDATRPANAAGDRLALGKLPADPAPVAGHASCNTRGKEIGEECRFLWPYLLDPNTGLPSTSPYNDTLGVCFAPSHFRYDPTGGSNATKTEPACASLRAGSAGDAGSDHTHACSDPVTGSEADCFAVTHRCYELAESAPIAAHVGTPDTAALRRPGGIVQPPASARVR